jgi:hypothetical protein
VKRQLLIGTAFLAVAFSDEAAEAVSFDFTFTDSLVTFTVLTTNTHQILAFGGQGSSGTLAFCRGSTQVVAALRSAVTSA